MTQRLIIPTDNASGLDANLAQHFGRAPYFTVVDVNESRQVVNVKTELNQGEHVGGTGHPHEHLLSLKPNLFVVFGMGPGCLRSLQESGITVLKAAGTTVKDITQLYQENKLELLTGSCPHSHHDGC